MASELERIDEQARRELERLGLEVTQAAIDGYKRGEIVFDYDKFLEETTEITINAKINATNLGLGGVASIASVNDISEYWLYKHYTGVELNLSQSLHNATKNAETAIKTTINQHIKDTTSWKKLSKDLNATTATKGDIPKVLKELEKQSKLVLGNNYATAAQKQELKRLLKKARKQVEELVKRGAPTTKTLRNAYARVINAVEKGDAEAIALKMQDAVRRKAMYNNDRISRSEIARAQREAFNRQSIEDGVEMVQVLLDSRHNVTDECDFLAGADLYNLGAGVYPYSKAPQNPFHTNCLCSVVARMKSIDDNRKAQFSDKRAKEYLSNLPDAKRERMLNGGNIKDWRQDLVGYDKELTEKPVALPKRLVAKPE